MQLLCQESRYDDLTVRQPELSPGKMAAAGLISKINNSGVSLMLRAAPQAYGFAEMITAGKAIRTPTLGGMGKSMDHLCPTSTAHLH